MTDAEKQREAIAKVLAASPDLHTTAEVWKRADLGVSREVIRARLQEGENIGHFRSWGKPPQWAVTAEGLAHYDLRQITRHRPVPNRWKGGKDEDRWEMVVEHDLFESDGPFEVTIAVDQGDGEAGGREVSTLVTASPAKARQMAAALVLYAGEAEEANLRRAEAEEP